MFKNEIEIVSKVLVQMEKMKKKSLKLMDNKDRKSVV